MAYFISFVWLGLSVGASVKGMESFSDFALAASLFFLGIAMIVSAIGKIGR